MRPVFLAVSAVAALLAAPVLAEDALNCDAVWSGYQGLPLDPKPTVEGDEQDPYERYRVGAELFGHAYEDIAARTPDEYKAAGGNPMMATLRLTFGHNLMTCYMQAATDQGGGGASFVQMIEKALPPKKRTALVEQYKLPE